MRVVRKAALPSTIGKVCRKPYQTLRKRVHTVRATGVTDTQRSLELSLSWIFSFIPAVVIDAIITGLRSQEGSGVPSVLEPAPRQAGVGLTETTAGSCVTSPSRRPGCVLTVGALSWFLILFDLLQSLCTSVWAPATL